MSPVESGDHSHRKRMLAYSDFASETRLHEESYINSQYRTAHIDKLDGTCCDLEQIEYYSWGI